MTLGSYHRVASTGEKEAVELRDGDQSRYQGKGGGKAVAGINQEVRLAVIGSAFADQASFDKMLIDLDGTPNKARLGANAILAASIAFARVKAMSKKIPLYRARYISDAGPMYECDQRWMSRGQ